MPIYDKISLLLVERDQQLLNDLESIFKPLYRTQSEHSGLAALERMRTEEFSFVIVDNDLDDMSGTAFLRETQMDPALSTVPIILLLEDDREEMLVQAYSAGASGIQMKPVRLRALRVYVEMKLRQFNSSFYHCVQNDSIPLPPSKTDSLTGLMQRSSFSKAADERIANKDPNYYVIECFDVDHFKVLNDQYGLAIGDRILQRLADIIMQHMRQCGGLACRMFADNFAVMVPQHHLDILTAMRAALETAAKGESYASRIHISCGCCVVDNKELSASTILDRAILAKSTVKGRYDVHVAYYDEAMREKLLEEQWILGEMEQALENRQFAVWLQPQYDLSGGQLIGAEALVRWNHPERGLISPSKFIGLFERNGFIYRLDMFIWEEACRCLRQWMDDGIEPLPISVNVSRYDLFHQGFLDSITGIVEKYNIPKNLFRVEITESAFVKSANHMIDVVSRLQRYGLMVEIDDFGSGYSSFNTLKDVSADVLKIDMRFLSDCDNSPRSGNILESIVRMAKWLGMRVIAEGVEKQEQADYLRSIGCPYVQGFLYGTPMPIAEYENVMGTMEKGYDTTSVQSTTGMSPDAFWNPASLETLVFNRYAGGACVFELCGNSLEMLRVNEKFMATFRLNMSEHAVLGKTDLFPFPVADKNEVRHLLRTAIHSGNPEMLEAVCDLTAHGGSVENIRFTVRMIAHTEDRYLFYQYVENITAQRQAENEMQETANQLQFLNRAAASLLQSVHPKDAVESLLEMFRDYFEAERVYLIEIDNDKMTSDTTYEVCAAGIEPLREKYHSIPYQPELEWFKLYETHTAIVIEDVKTCTAYPETCEMLLQGGVFSHAGLPLRLNGVLVGTVNVNNARRNLSHLMHLSAIGDYLSVMLQRLKTLEKVTQDNKILRSILNEMPCGFAEVIVPAAEQNECTRIQLANDGFCKLLRMDMDAVMNLQVSDFEALIHADDLENFKECKERMKNGESFAVGKFKLQDSKGVYTETTVYFRNNTMTDGSMLMNLYFFDATDLNYYL